MSKGCLHGLTYAAGQNGEPQDVWVQNLASRHTNATQYVYVDSKHEGLIFRLSRGGELVLLRPATRFRSDL